MHSMIQHKELIQNIYQYLIGKGDIQNEFLAKIFIHEFLIKQQKIKMGGAIIKIIK